VTTRIPTPRPLQLAGTLSEARLVQVLRLVFVRQLSGHLVFGRSGQTISLRFFGGHLVSGSSDLVVGRLGEFLLRAGLLTRADLEIMLEKAVLEGRRLGPVVVEEGLATHGQVEEILGLQARAVLFTALAWDSGSFRFDPADCLPPLEEVSLSISTAQLILEVIAQIKDASVREALGQLDRPLSAVENPPTRLQAMTLCPADAFVLSRADGTLSASEILAITPLSRESVERSLLGLLSVGVVECRTRRPLPKPEVGSSREAARIRSAEDRKRRLQEIDSVFVGLSGRSDEGVLSVSAEAGAGEIRAQYERLIRKFHPDTLADAPAEYHHKIRSIFMRISEAYSALRSKASKPGLPRQEHADPRNDSATAKALLALPEESLRAAGALLSEHPWQALAIAEDVIPRTTGVLRREARLLRARVLLGSPGSLRAAEAELRELLQEDPGFVDALLALGGFYRDRGLNARAASVYRKVLEVHPGDRRATAELRVLESDPNGRRASQPSAPRP